MIPRLSVRRLHKKWGDFSLHASFDLGPGEFLTVLGPSGAGKSSLLRLIAGLESPDGGSILLDGEDLLGRPPERRGVGMVFQDLALFPHMSVEANIAYGLRASGKKPAECKRRVSIALGEIGLEGFGRRNVGSLSGGERQRVALARSLVLRPSVMLLDEPLSSLDRPLRRRLGLDIRSRLKDAGITAVLVTHDQEEALSLSDSILIMREGRIVDSGSPKELKSGGFHPFTEEFLGGGGKGPTG